MKIMIVDDEVIIRTGLCTVIDWKELGLDLLPPAESAEEALERIPLEKPHILLTDIRMSGMDGIELARKVGELLPDTEIIILTGYDDFGYAQQALREGVTDYLLKTSRPEEIIKAAMKAKQNVMDKWELIKQDHRQQAALRHQWLERLLQGSLQEDPVAQSQLCEWFQRSHINREPDSGCAAAMQVLLIAASGWGEAPFTGLLQGAVENILVELLPCVSLLHKDYLLLIVRHEAGLSDEEGLKRALKRVTDTLKCSAFAALGHVVSSEEQLQDSYRVAKEVFSYQGLLGTHGVFTQADIEARGGSRSVCSDKEEAELTALLMSDNATELRHWVNHKVRVQLEDAAATPQTVQGYLQSLMIAGHRWLERARSSQAATEAPPVITLEGRPEDEVFKVLLTVMSSFHQGLEHNRYAYVHKAVAYIRDNLDQAISLQQVAGFVHVNPNHFSEVFKRETGYTYIEFVTKERMKRAIEILQSTQAKVSDVARMVGYEDIKYFTQQFKKHTGRTPSEFRQGSKD